MPDLLVPAFFLLINSMKYILRFIFIYCFSGIVHAQDVSQLRYEHDFLSQSFHKNRREEVRKLMPDSSVAILFTAPVRNRSNDTYYSYHQAPNFYYLTGFTQPNAVLMIFKNPLKINNESTDEILFIAQVEKSKELWTGHMATQIEATEISGVKMVLTSHDFSIGTFSNKDFKSVLYLNPPTGIADDKNDSLDLFELTKIFNEKFSFPPPNGDSFLLGNILKRLREVKEKEELELLRKAVTMTCSAHLEKMKVLKPGMTEYQVQAVGEFVFKNSGAEYVGYASICGAGLNSCILHYETNRKTLKDGELILLDMGAEYHGYTADVTRTLPVNGKFSLEQKIIYDLVLHARDSALTLCKPGSDFRDPHNAVVEIIRKGLLMLGIIHAESEYKNYFMHGTSHYLGLDVHDLGTFGKLKEGNVITVEPGIYIPSESKCDPKWWNIGVRIEDDVLITRSGHENLSGSLPVKAADIEEEMKKAPDFFLQQNK